MSAYLKKSGWGVTKPPYGARLNYGHSLCNGLRGAWLLNEGAGKVVIDATEGTPAGTVGGTAAWTVGNFNSPAASFPGVDGSSISIPSSSILNATYSALSISAWVKTIDFSSNQGIFDHTNAGSTNASWQIFLQSSSLLIRIKTTGIIDASKNVTAAINNVWIHVVGTYDGTAVKVYLNAIQGTDGAQTGTVQTTGITLIGQLGTGVYPWNGAIENVLFWNRALTQQEIEQLYAEPFAVYASPKKRFARAAAAGGGVFGSNFYRQVAGLGGGF